MKHVVILFSSLVLLLPLGCETASTQSVDAGDVVILDSGLLDSEDAGSDAGLPEADAGSTGGDAGSIIPTLDGGLAEYVGAPEEGVRCGDNLDPCAVGASCCLTVSFATLSLSGECSSTEASEADDDAGTTSTDAGTTSTDAGTTPTDAGTTSTDAGTTSTDAGTTSTDAGTAPILPAFGQCPDVTGSFEISCDDAQDCGGGDDIVCCGGVIFAIPNVNIQTSCMTRGECAVLDLNGDDTPDSSEVCTASSDCSDGKLCCGVETDLLSIPADFGFCRDTCEL